MSIYYSRYGLNTYAATPYFQAHIPKDYPLNRVLQKSRAFRRLPKRLRELAEMAKKWAIRTYTDIPGGARDIERWYDDEGYEICPGDKHRLTDEEIDAQWQPNPWADDFEVEDIPLPKGGFADPDTWEEPEKPDEEEEYDGPTEEQILHDIHARDREYAARYYGVEDQLKHVKSDKELAHLIYERLTGSAGISP